MNWSRVRSAILPNESSGFIFNWILFFHGFHRSHRFLINGMVRSEFYNGALNKISSWANPPSRYWFEALYFLFFYEQIHIIMCKSVLLLYYIFFIRWFKDLTYWNHISFLFIFFLSLTFPFIRILFSFLYFSFVWR